MTYPVNGHCNGNNPQEEAVEICIADPAIAALFAELLIAKNIHVVLSSLDTLRHRGKIITELQYFRTLQSSYAPEDCLVVENSRSIPPLKAHTLIRPLTEEKIDQALKALLEGKSPVETQEPESL